MLVARRITPVLLALLTVASASPSARWTTSKVKDSIEPPRNWINIGEAPANHFINLRIALPQPNFSELERHLYEVSDPTHERYGSHLSKETVEELVKPSEESMDAVGRWLEEYNIQEKDCKKSESSDWVRVRVPVALAEKMLNTKYYTWKHAVDGEIIVRTTSYGLPEAIHGHVLGVQPTTMFGRFNKHRSSISIIKDAPEVSANNGTITSASGTVVDGSCNSTITVSCLKELYNVTGNASTTNGNMIGLAGYLEDYANFQDLQDFYAEQVPEAVGSNFSYVLINGGQLNQSEPGEESDLDMQFGLGLSYPTKGVFYSTGGSPPFTPDAITTTDSNEPYLDWLDYVLNASSVPQTISTSYGDDEQTVPYDYAVAACNGFAQLGARGVSLLFSSGDSGVGDGILDPKEQTCFSNNGTNATIFIPEFPASCPYVTTVGGTQSIPEVAVSRFFSGGGFSNYFARPSYQDDAVTTYLSSLPNGTYAGLYNASGRAYPDVSAQGDRLRIFFDGDATPIGGTSASSPVFAAVVALLNNERIDAGLSPLGFLNPMLYSVGFKGLTDITEGHNTGCGTTGFNTSEGWDAVTGLGTPNFGLLKDILLTLP
ncbi:subtilisin-like protein [Stereum hirsutum FP-91666 SS1]|uniref:subtilisin-like protein n=1 Tax=Stereum hirsutum (strain FP-91666) TaxID=721885 RepID=UPI000440D850|nr:subtilisin-like protein [Stereum hirsutum FP-91666 SS1]EIM89124.1 subtilisin-like protein [Stereum hirsutum FP-91666 SS1]